MTPEQAYQRCKKEKRRIPELEEMIAQDAYFSYQYACLILNGEFELGEKVISENVQIAYWYATDAKKKRFPLCEQKIIENPEYAYLYAKEVIQSVFPEAHHMIFNSIWKNDYVSYLKDINYDLGEISEWLI